MIQYLYKSIIIILCALNLHQGPKCSLNTRRHFVEPLPVILRNGDFLEPSDYNGNVELRYGESLTLSCGDAGEIVHPYMIPDNRMSTATITCEGGDTFNNPEWLNGPSAFYLFRCSNPPNHSSRKTERTCFENNSVYEVGYSVQGHFYPLYESCFNEAFLTPIYSKYTQKPYNALFQTRVDRPYFIAENVFGNVPVDSIYRPDGLKRALAHLVGSKVDSYVTGTQQLSRGHLAAKTDFVYAFGERATFHYVNCAPQWTGFNGGNWNTLEVDLRQHIHMVGYSTIVYTGTYGVSHLTNSANQTVLLYLYTDNNNNQMVPVPLYYYKVVYEPSSKCGIAFIGINNPHLSIAEANKLFFCQDVCRNNSRFSWLSWHPDNPMEGYTFCCSVPNFSETVSHLPQLEVDCLLI